MMETVALRGAGLFQAPPHPIQPAWIPEGDEYLEILTGGRIYFEVDGVDREFGRGVIFWHTAGEHTVYRTVGSDYYSCLTLRFSGGAARRHIGRIGFWTDLATLNDFCRETLRVTHDAKTDWAVFGPMLYWRLMWEMKRSADPATDYPAALTRLLRRIDREAARDWTVAELARAGGVSESYLHSLFERHLGIPPHRYLVERRLHQARIELAGSARPIKEIAEGCGFANIESFYRAFRKRCGMTPAAYRRSHVAQHNPFEEEGRVQ